MIIDILELQNAVQEICKKYIENNGRYLETEEDNFWFIDMEMGLDLDRISNMFKIISFEIEKRKDKRL